MLIPIYYLPVVFAAYGIAHLALEEVNDTYSDEEDNDHSNCDGYCILHNNNNNNNSNQVNNTQVDGTTMSSTAEETTCVCHALTGGRHSPDQNPTAMTHGDVFSPGNFTENAHRPAGQLLVVQSHAQAAFNEFKTRLHNLAASGRGRPLRELYPLLAEVWNAQALFQNTVLVHFLRCQIEERVEHGDEAVGVRRQAVDQYLDGVRVVFSVCEELEEVVTKSEEGQGTLSTMSAEDEDRVSEEVVTVACWACGLLDDLEDGVREYLEDLGAELEAAAAAAAANAA